MEWPWWLFVDGEPFEAREPGSMRAASLGALHHAAHNEVLPYLVRQTARAELRRRQLVVIAWIAAAGAAGAFLGLLA